MYHWMLRRSAAQALDRAHELHVVIVQSSYDYGQSLQVINITHISLRCTLSGRPEVGGTHGGMKVESNRCPISTYYFSNIACSLYSALPCTTSSTSLLLSVTVHALHLNGREDIGWHKICGYQEHRRVAVSVRHMCAGYDTHLIGIYVLSWYNVVPIFLRYLESVDDQWQWPPVRISSEEETARCWRIRILASCWPHFRYGSEIFLLDTIVIVWARIYTFDCSTRIRVSDVCLLILVDQYCKILLVAFKSFTKVRIKS